nr:hypothetical protein [Tanacetum cinerariifolium]
MISVMYITYSKEEESVRCIQSVHGYVLDGRYLSIGAEEDSFGKDEIAAVLTSSGNYCVSSFEERALNSGLKDVAYAAVASVDHKDGIVKSSKHTTFVDIVEGLVVEVQVQIKM